MKIQDDAHPAVKTLYAGLTRTRRLRERTRLKPCQKRVFVPYFLYEYSCKCLSVRLKCQIWRHKQRWPHWCAFTYRTQISCQVNSLLPGSKRRTFHSPHDLRSKGRKGYKLQWAGPDRVFYARCRTCPYRMRKKQLFNCTFKRKKSVLRPRPDLWRNFFSYNNQRQRYHSPSLKFKWNQNLRRVRNPKPDFTASVRRPLSLPGWRTILIVPA